MDELIEIFGSYDENMRVLEAETGVKISARDRQLAISGSEGSVDVAREVIVKLLEMINRREPIDKSRIRYAIELAREGNADLISEIMSDVVLVTYKGKPIKCKTMGQRKYIEAIRKNTMVFSIGPAGTGKTYLAMAMAVLALKNKEVSRIILTRPAVEAGEKLGFLPGDLQNKVDPYLRPLYDALYEMIGAEAFARHSERGVIEVAPMAYMRGRTLNESFVILDEAQNTTPEQMKMFLTRLGMGSKMIINGDVTQIDLPPEKRSGLQDAARILAGIKDIAVVNLTARDVVRHELVQSIIRAYEERSKRQKGRPASRGNS
ncbi:MAG: phosphate starvation-inducible protein PhoH [Clostridiales bacterium]|nr:phosphate starvation-inducible protein PhoH [Clostridiales bacterium]